MIVTKNILFLVLLVSLSGFVSVQKTGDFSRWVVVPGGSLRVDGSTNVNKFSCEIVNYSKPDTLTVSQNYLREGVSLTGNVRLDVQHFDCHNPVMTGDLRKTLKAKEYPKLSIKFINLSRLPELPGTQTIRGLVDIQLAGVVKRFDVNYRFLKDGQKIQLIGTKEINFSDFNLTPPRKLGGMIQTDNKLKVEFQLKMKVLD